jgi:YegS/Rv2252/BmrU family lipid kinase
MPRRFVAFINPSTRGNAAKLRALLERAAPDDVQLTIHETTTDELDPALIPSDGSIEAVIAVGGDGTVAEVATAVGDRRIPLGIIPGGSTNIIGRYGGVPRNAKQAAALIFGQHAIRPIDAAECRGKRFLHMAGAGFDSRLFLATDRRLKRRMGWIAYFSGAARSVFLPPSRFTVDVDGNVIEVVSPFVLIANGAAIVHPMFTIHPSIANDDGLLDVVIFTATNARGVLRALIRFATRSLPKSKEVIHLQGKSILLDATPPMPVQLDGDVFGETPARFTISKQPTLLIVPVKKSTQAEHND